MADTLKAIGFRMYFDNAVDHINRSYNEALLHLLLASLFMRTSPLQVEVYSRWLQYTAKTPDRIKYAIKDIIYNVLTKPIRMEMGGRYFQIFGDSEKLQIPCNIPNFFFVLTLYPKLEPFFDSKTISSPTPIVHFTRYQYNDILQTILKRDLICMDFLYFFLNDGVKEHYSTRRNIVNLALRELFSEFKNMGQESADFEISSTMSIVWTVAEKMGFTQQKYSYENVTQNEHTTDHEILEYEDYEG